MKPRKNELGTRNMIGAVITRLRREKGITQKQLLAQLQTRGIDITASGVSKLEGQTRQVNETELIALADIFAVTIDDLIPPEKRAQYEKEKEK